MTHWSARYLGIPYRPLGRDADGADCWGLLRLVHAAELGIELPAHDGSYASDHDAAGIAALIEGAPDWADWREVEAPEPFDAALFRRGPHRSHVGIVVRPGMMLHMAETGARIEDYRLPRWSGRLTGSYRHRQRGAGVPAGTAPARAAPAPAAAIGMVPVLAAPLIDPGAGRIALDLPEGMTLAGIVSHVLPGLCPDDLALVQLSLVTPAGAEAIDPALWPRMRPKAGVRVVIRLVPGKNAMRSVLMIVVSVAALALGGMLAPALAGATGMGLGVAKGLLTAGLTMVGQMLASALVPLPQPPAPGDSKTRYTIGAPRNDERPDRPVPMPLGRLRFAPPFAATSHTEIVGNDQYVRALFCFGDGPLHLSAFQIGDTGLDKYRDVEIEVREGWPSDAPLTLYPRQVLEEAANAELTRPKPRDASGEVIGGPAEEIPVQRFTAFDCWACTVIVGLPAGLFEMEDDGDLRSRSVAVRIRQRQPGDVDWQEVVTLTIRAKEREPFFRSHTWVFPSRGRWELEITRMTDETTSTRVSDRTLLAAIQSIRPEYPIHSDRPLALVALRIRATHQLSGALDTFSALVQRHGRHWNGSAWQDNVLTRNPAAAFLHALQGGQTHFPAPDSDIDMALIADWYAWCAARGLEYNAVHEDDASLLEALTAICSAGRASPRHDMLRWGVVIDRPGDLAVDHINPRNAAEFGWSRSYFDPPDAFRVKFLDETAEYDPAERIVPWPGHEGEIRLIESIELPGKTHPDEVWRECRRRMYEMIHRPDTFSALQSGRAGIATRGDLVMGSWDVLARGMIAARVRGMIGSLIELDEEIAMEAGSEYGLRFAVMAPDPADPDRALTTSVLRAVAWRAGPSRVLQILDPSDMPAPGAVVHVGVLGQESLALRVKGVEAGEGGTSVLRMVAAAEIIDTLTDAEVPPDWSGRVGTVLGGSVTPLAPVHVSIRSDAHPVQELIRVEGGAYEWGPITGYTYTVTVELQPAPEDFAILNSWRVEWRMSGAAPWNSISVSSGAAVAISSPEFGAGDTVTLRAHAVAIDGTEGPAAGERSIGIGMAELLPGAIPDSAVALTPGPGHVRVILSVPNDDRLAQVQLYRVPAGATLDRALHRAGAPWPVTPRSSAEHVDGDATRVNLLAEPSFGIGSPWTTGDGWIIAAGVASHAPGLAGALSQAAALTAGTWYRWQAVVAGRSAGTLTPRLSGGSDQDGAAIAAGGLASGRIQAAAGNAAFALLASTGFDGSVDDVVLFAETDRCLPIGTFEYHLEPQTSQGWPGQISGPFTVTIP